MNASILGRMLWKEYRTQRGLWLAIVGFYIALVLSIFVMFGGEGMPNFEGLFGSGIAATFFYIFGSASVAYASEREQGTDVWLRTVPMGPTRLLTAKLMWIVLSSLAALAVFAVTAKLFATPSGIDWASLGIIGLLMSLVLSGSLVASLLTDHVLKAVSVAFAMLVAVIIGAISLRDADNIIAYGILPTALFAVVIELNRRWLRESSTSWKLTLPQGRRLTLDQALALPVESSSSMRLWSRELKLEAWNARWWLLLLGVGAAALLLSTDLRMPSEVRALQFGVIVCFVPLMCGIGTCAGEQLRGRYLFQGHRGVSSAMLILAKHVVWFAGGLALVFLLSWWSWSLVELAPSIRANSLAGSYNIIPFPSRMLPSAVAAEFAQSPIPGLQFAFATGVLMYAVGNFCSLVITIPLMSIFAAVIGGVVAWCGLLYSTVLGVPLYVAAVCPIVAFLVLPLVRGSEWVIGNKSKASWLRFTGWLFLAVWTLITLHAGWRILEISTVETTAAGTASTLGVSYLTWSAVVFFAVLVGVWMIDLFRRRIDGRRWLSVATVAVLFLVAHNSMIAIRAFGYAAYVNHRSQPLREAYEIVLLEQTQTDDARLANDAIVSPLPVPQDFRGVRPENARGSRIALAVALGHQIPWRSWDDVLPEQREWLAQNEAALELFQKAAAAEFPSSGVIVVIRDGKPIAVPIDLWDNYGKLIDLVRLKAFEREHAGELDEAWSYHISLVRFFRRCLMDAPPTIRYWCMNWLKAIVIEHDLQRWQARREQTPERLANATAEMARELQIWPSLSLSYQRWGGEIYAYFDLKSYKTRLEDALLPWERTRALALIAITIDDCIDILAPMESGDRLIRQWNDSGVTTYNLPWDGRHEQLILRNAKGGRRFTRLELRRQSDSQTSGDREVATTMFPQLQLFETSVAMQRIGDYSAALQNAETISMIEDDFAADLLREIEFYQAVKTWLASSALYSYCAETGDFPRTIEEILLAPNTVQRMSPALKHVTTRYNAPQPIYHRLRLTLNGLPNYGDPFPIGWNSDTNRTKWPEPEYQITPESNSENPLSAPQPEAIPR